MKRSGLLIKLAMVSTLVLGAQAAHSYERCKTQSNGYHFSGGGYDLQSAMQMAINECTSSRYTTDGQCRGNVQCEEPNGQYQLAQIRCRTSANGYHFTGGASTLGHAIADAEVACTSSRYTDNSTCRANLRCESAFTRLQEVNVKCKASANGYNFLGGDRSLEGAIADVTRACTSSRYTSDSTCRASVQCAQPESHHYLTVNWSCRTTANGYSFSGGSATERGAVDDVLQACTSSRYTSDGQCYANIRCEAPQMNRSVRPLPPAPPVIVTPVRPRLNFRVESLQMAERVIALVEAFEPYVNADDYITLMLPLKKQAGRLSARVEGRAEYVRVKNTLVHLGTLLADSEAFIEENMERAALFQASKELLTMREKVRSLVNFMEEFDGNRTDLY